MAVAEQCGCMRKSEKRKIWRRRSSDRERKSVKGVRLWDGKKMLAPALDGNVLLLLVSRQSG